MYDVSMIDGHIDEPKMTDNEIIRAVGLCNGIESGRCDECSYRNTKDGDCVEILAKDTIDLINRLEAENERLKQDLKEAHIDIQEHMAEIERMRDISEALDIEHEAIRNCAVKEFVERLKEQIKYYTGMFTDEGFYVSLEAVLSAVDFIKEKMVGE